MRIGLVGVGLIPRRHYFSDVKIELPESLSKQPFFQLAQPVEKMRVSATLEMTRIVRESRRKGVDMVNFGLGQSPFGAPPSVQAALARNVHQTAYLPTEGIIELRKEIAGFYQRHFHFDVNPDQVVIGPGSKELLFITMAALNSPWLFISPSWVTYETQAKLLGKETWRLFSSYKDEFRLKQKDLRKRLNQIDDKLDGRTLAILINYPNNPTGMTLTKDEVTKIARFARNNEIVILSDEIYGNITHPSFGFEHHSLACEYPEGTIVTGGMSKDRSMGGYRFGVAILPPDEKLLTRAFKSIGSETYSSVAAPIQYAALDAYKDSQKIDNFIKTSTEIHQLVGNVVQRELFSNGFQVSKPEGGFYLLPSLNHKVNELNEKGIYSSKDMVYTLINEYKVAVISGTAFGLRSDDLAFRLAYIDYDGPNVMEKYLKDTDAANAEPQQFVESYCPSIWNGVTRLKDFVDDYMKG